MMKDKQKPVNQREPKVEEPKKPPEPNYESMDEEELEELYMPRLKFDEEPKSTPKHYLPKLVQFICDGEDFNRKALTLIYRRSKNHPQIGDNLDLRCRNSLLILIKTANGQSVGGFVSAELPNKSVDYVKDPGAFLFTLSKGMKFNVKKNQANDAIFLSDQYLISFANDLMISSSCLT